MYNCTYRHNCSLELRLYLHMLVKIEDQHSGRLAEMFMSRLEVRIRASKEAFESSTEHYSFTVRHQRANLCACKQCFW